MSEDVDTTYKSRFLLAGSELMNWGVTHPWPAQGERNSSRDQAEHEYATKQDVEQFLIPPTESGMDASVARMDETRRQGDASEVGFAERQVLYSASAFAEAHRIHQHVPDQDHMGQAYHDIREMVDVAVKALNHAKDAVDDIHGHISWGGPVEQEVYMESAEAAFIAETQLRDARDHLYRITTPVIPGKDHYDFVHLIPDPEGTTRPEEAVLEASPNPPRTLDEARERMIEVCEFDVSDPMAHETLTPVQQSQHVGAVVDAVDTFRSMQQRKGEDHDGNTDEV